MTSPNVQFCIKIVFDVNINLILKLIDHSVEGQQGVRFPQRGGTSEGHGRIRTFLIHCKGHRSCHHRRTP